MVAVKAQDVDRLVRSPDPKIPIVLLYGPDLGLISERARTFAKASGVDASDPFAWVKLDGIVIATDPARLVDEIGTVGMFGGKRLIHVRMGDLPPGQAKSFGEAVMRALSAKFIDTSMLIEAGDIRRGSPLLLAVERAPNALAMPCYLEDEAGLRRLATAVFQENGFSIDQDAMALVLRSIGADRAASRAELDKLCLYARGSKAITVADVAAVMGDAAALTTDDIVDAAFVGDAATLDRLLGRSADSDFAPPQIMSAALRHLMALHKARLFMERHRASASDTAERAFEPKLFFKRKKIVERQLVIWTAARLEKLVGRFAEASLETRTKPAIAEALTNRTLMSIAVQARQAGR